MRAHDSVEVIPALFDFVKEHSSEPTLTVVAVNHQLGDPANSLAISSPAAGEGVTSKVAIDGNADIRGVAAGKVFITKSLLA